MSDDELHVYRGEFVNPAGNPTDLEEVFFDAIDRADAEAQAEEYVNTHPFEVFLKSSLEKIDEVSP